MSDLISRINFLVVGNTPFDAIRNKYGQKFLVEYDEWSKKDSGSIFFYGRMNYFNLDSPHLKRFIEQIDKQMSFDFEE